MNKDDKLKEINQRKGSLDNLAKDKSDIEKTLSDFLAKDKIKKLTTAERLDRIEQMLGIE